MYDNTKNTKIDTNKIRNIGIENDKEWLVEDTRQMNFFIGPNNSGKSRKIREVLSSLRQDDNSKRRAIFQHRQCAAPEILKLFDSLSTNRIRTTHTSISMNYSDITNHLNEFSHSPFKLSEIITNQIQELHKKHSLSLSTEDIEQFIIIISRKLFQSGSDLEKYENAFSNIDWKLAYIPTLRSLRHVSNDDAYLARTQKDYFPDLANLEESPNNLTIFTGHSLYKDLQAHLLGSHEKRERIRKYEEYLSENFFFGGTITLVPMIEKDVVYIKQGGEEDRPIYNLGDGIQSIILLTYPVFMAEHPTMFFIEEPEHFLHAGLQHTLVETFARHKEHMFFMTTHSNHFLDIAQERDDISIQQVSRRTIKQDENQKKPSYETLVEPVSDYSYVLNELGVRASSVLLANCSIWVEGVTDKLYLRTYLKKFIDELKDEAEVNNCGDTHARAAKLSNYHENLHFIFTEYQGSNITHWNFGNPNDSCDNDSGDNPDNNNHTRNQSQNEQETQTPARKLNSKILLVADGDIAGKSDRVTNLKKQLGIKCEVLKYKEIENYLPLEILKETVKARWNSFRGTDEFNIEAINTLKENQYQTNDQGIGKLIELCVKNNDASIDKKERSFFAASSGTIKDKVTFCKKAVEIMNRDKKEWESCSELGKGWELTSELKELCDKIWTHIEQSNGNSS